MQQQNGPRYGRTRRKRRRKKALEQLDHQPELIELRRWLSKNGWRNEAKLKLMNFPESGRGVTSSKAVEENDILIVVPYNAMITYTTIQTSLKEVISPSSDVLLKMHDLLTLFLVTEKGKERSLWREYINSLPKDAPYLPWLATSEELNLYPEDLQIISMKKRENLQESMYRVNKSIQKRCDCVLDENLFQWGYVVVNTRAVYVDPCLVRRMNVNVLENVLGDEPSMALCPFLDMFNHDYRAKNEATLVYRGGRWAYELRTFSNRGKYEEIFISYGPHDNVKLVMEYGFFLPANTFDTVVFEFQEVLNVFRVALSGRQYRFLKDHRLDEGGGLYIGYDGISYNLKAVLFVCFNEDVRDYNSVIYGDCYSQDFLQSLPKWRDGLLGHKFEVFVKDYEKLENCGFKKTDHAQLMTHFLMYRMDFVQNLMHFLRDVQI